MKRKSFYAAVGMLVAAPFFFSFLSSTKENRENTEKIASQTQAVKELTKKLSEITEDEKKIDGVWIWEIGSGDNRLNDYVYYSPRFREIFGYSKEEFPDLFSSWMKIVNPEDLEVATKNMAKHIETIGVHPYWQEVRYKHKDGHIVWVICEGDVVFDSNGNPLRAIGVHKEIEVSNKRVMANW